MDYNTDLFEAATIARMLEHFRTLLKSIVADPEQHVSKLAAGAFLVAIQPHGSRPRFFCVHGADDKVLGFRALAQHLGPDRPFYGCRVPGRDEERSILEDTASSCIRELRELQSEDPYFLGGYSFGGIVAFEMARQLRAQGQDVGLLALFDTGQPDYLKVSIPTRLYYHVRSLRCMGPLRYAQEKAWEGIKRRIRNSAYKLSLRFGHSHQQAKQGPNYKAQPYPGRVTLFRAAGSWGVRPNDPYLGWNRVAAGGVEVHEVTGKPHTLFIEPHVRVLAARLKTCLDQAQASSS